MTFIDTDRDTERSRLALAVAAVSLRRGHPTMLLGCANGADAPETTELGKLADDAGLTFRLLLRRARFDPALLGQITAAFTRFAPDAFLTHDDLGLILHRLPKRRPPFWFALHNPDPDRPEPEGRIRARLIRSTLNRATGVLARDDADRKALAARGVQEARIVSLWKNGEAHSKTQTPDLRAVADAVIDVIQAGSDAT